jgi:hypothetical protein
VPQWGGFRSHDDRVTAATQAAWTLTRSRGNRVATTWGVMS